MRTTFLMNRQLGKALVIFLLCLTAGTAHPNDLSDQKAARLIPLK
jgi:hypothetical protein